MAKTQREKKAESARKRVADLPILLKDITKYVDELLNNESTALLEGGGGGLGILVRIFGRDLLEKRLEKKEKELHDGFGFQTYQIAAIRQSHLSLQEIETKHGQDINPNELIRLYKDMESEKVEFDPDSIALTLFPTTHPAVEFVRNYVVSVLKQVGVQQDGQDAFLKHFNQNIESTLKDIFGDEWQNHQDELEELWLNRAETDYLNKLIADGRIGFDSDEDLQYQPTFARWSPVKQLSQQDEDDVEEGLEPIENLIDTYYENVDKEQILFIVAGFGKGKSVFMRHQAAQMALQFLRRGEGHFPVYFNLRDYGKEVYDPNISTGILGDALRHDGDINIDDNRFKNYQYTFFVDSLDESGDLNESRIKTVIRSILDIRRRSGNKSQDRIIISSRPIGEFLKNIVQDYKPHTITNKEGQKIDNFVALYGFKKSQFNDWLNDSLACSLAKESFSGVGIAKKWIKAIKAGKPEDIHDALTKEEILSSDELQRPIFAYMLYRLIINGHDFSGARKIGLYLSFINLLTNEAKFTDDKKIRVNLQTELQFRNILHATAALWMLKRHDNRQSMLARADICRAVAGEPLNCDDDLQKYSDVLSVEFLSHSYLGESEDTFYFQHQSFAEVLVAEYYLKVFIRHALDSEGGDSHQARIHLLLGEPTPATGRFFFDLLALLRRSAKSNKDKTTIEARRMLLPLLASLATNKYNPHLYCAPLKYNWFDATALNKQQEPIKGRHKALEKWPIDEEAIEKIAQLAHDILASKKDLLPIQASQKKILFAEDGALEFQQPLKDIAPDIDRWLALIVGNTLINDREKEHFFLAKYFKNAINLFSLIKNWNHFAQSSTPGWCREVRICRLFIGILADGTGGDANLEYSKFNLVDFSYATLQNINFESCNFAGSDFSFSKLLEINFKKSLIMHVGFINIRQLLNVKFHYCELMFGIYFPYDIANLICSDRLLDFGYKKSLVNSNTKKLFDNISLVVNVIIDLSRYILKENPSRIDMIKNSFEFEKKGHEIQFHNAIDKVLEEVQAENNKIEKI
ncbi:MAG: pentapeptide repeat-containing protein [Magnetococcales bacterium]|nr:pentapeptide repeat-containing protein [Magnetococcales bacterium]